ncbi:hypothetical protein [Methylorubrum sp. SB2]|uniref:hypothetical protein n=1 Tax=Methylorubrum subtropicum TaxID=3138812 RepID=UPI00313E3597
MPFIRETICAVAIGFSATVAHAQEAAPTIAEEGDWVLKKSENSSGPGAACILAPKSRSRIQIVGDRLEVTGLPKNSIFNYQYRIDDGPVSSIGFPTASMQQAGAVTLEGAAFESILNGRRFSIRLLDRWHEAITEEVSLAGLRSLRDRSAEACR